MRYTCRICGKAKNSKDEDYDYYYDGVACETCLDSDGENEVEEVSDDNSNLQR